MLRAWACWIAVCFAVAGCTGDDDVGMTGSSGAAGAGGAAGSSGSAGVGGIVDAGGGSSGAAGNAGAGPGDANAEVAEEPSEDSIGAESTSDVVGEIGSDSRVDEPEDSAPPEASLSDVREAGAAPKVCAEPCTVDDDCARDSGVQKYVCHPTTHRCTTCIDDLICVAARSLWTAKTCTLDFDCINEGGFSPFGDVCIDVGGVGQCAFLSTSTANCTSILNTSTFSTFVVKKYGSSDQASVCGKPSRCDADRGSCQNPCTSNTSCTPVRGGKTCNTVVGRCECASDADCGPGAPTCNLTIKQCECGSASDCSADTGRTLACQ
jgi:hypothetical protein